MKKLICCVGSDPKVSLCRGASVCGGLEGVYKEVRRIQSYWAGGQ